MPSSPVAARQQFQAYRDQVLHNFVDTDPHLRSIFEHYGRTDALDAVHAFGGVSAATLDPLVRENNRDEHLPRLRRYDGQGNRIEQVAFHPSYHQIGRHAYATGAMSLYAQPGHELETLAYEYLLSMNGEAGHACPFACTAGLIKILQRADDFPEREAWLQRLLDPHYDSHFHGSQFLTEVQGGSDVGANAVVARPAEDGAFTIHGEKWFCSVIDAQLFLVTARPEGGTAGTKGLRAFAVPRTLPDGTTNHFHVRRLKFKLGTRSMASAEVDFEGAWARPVGTFRDTVEVVLNTSRLYNATCSCGTMQRAWLEADRYARNRLAFGQPILNFPGVARIVARLRAEAYGARATTFLLANLADRIATGAGSDQDRAAYRMLVNLNKYWTSVQGTTCVRDAIEVFGGNGAIEEFTVLPRLLRDAIVCEAWEGGHNVLCAQVLKDAHRFELHTAGFALLESLAGPFPELTAARERFERVLQMPEPAASAHMRDVADSLRPAAQAAALRAEAARDGADPLCAVAAEHLLALHGVGYDPLDDEGLMPRVRHLIAL